MSCFNPKRGLLAGTLVGGIVGVWVFAWCCATAAMPAVTEVSLCWGFRPWWRGSNWMAALVVALAVGLPVGTLAAFRPVVMFPPSVAPRTPMQQLGWFLQGFFLGVLVLPFAAAPVMLGLALAFPGVVAQWQLFVLLGVAAAGCGAWAMRKK